MKRWNEVMLNLWDQAVIFTLNTSFLGEGSIAEAKAAVSVSKGTAALPGIFILVQNCKLLTANGVSVNHHTVIF